MRTNDSLSCVRCHSAHEDAFYLTCTPCRAKARAYGRTYRAIHRKAGPPYGLAPEIPGPAIASHGAWHPLYAPPAAGGTLVLHSEPSHV